MQIPALLKPPAKKDNKAGEPYASLTSMKKQVRKEMVQSFEKFGFLKEKKHPTPTS